MEKKESNNSRFKQKLTNKYRLVILNDDTFEERFSFKLSRLNVFVLGGFFSIFLVILTIIFIAYTPLKEYIPGYSSLKLKKKATQLVYEADSLKIKLTALQSYTEALRSVMTGDISLEKLDSLKNESVKIVVNENKLNATKEDSLFREKVERRDRFPLVDNNNNKGKIVFFAPVSGNLTQEFNAKNKHFAVDIVAKTSTPVKAITDGTVIFSEWTTETGYVIILEHPKGFVSVYKHNGVLLKEQGDLVKSGEVIATVGSTGELTTGPHLHFELWNEGYPVNPINYIDFK